jgi:hypothetical protein
MDQALVQVGLPVRCSWGECSTQGFVKPRTDYGGWMRRSTKRWYCPDHAKKAKEHYDSIVEQYRNPKPEPAPTNTTEELYKLLD